MNPTLFFYDAAPPAGELVAASRRVAPGMCFLVTEGGEAAAARWQELARAPLAALDDAAPHGRRAPILDVTDPQRLSRLLALLKDARDVAVFAPITAHYWRHRPVFINSVPKCGTHLLSTCLAAMGLKPPPLDARPEMSGPFEGGTFYNLQHLRVDDIAGQYRRIGPFIDALATSALVFINRDPRDAIVSLANYLPRQGEYHLLARFMQEMTAEERINTIILGTYPIPVFINGTYCLDDTIATLFASYERWRPERWPNLWPVRYEDLVGPKGLGTREAQLGAIWGLQLALHVPGEPAAIADKVFSEKSPTFFKGTIGRHQVDFSAANRRALETLSCDFMVKAGYADRWRIERSFAVRVAASDRETAQEAARALYGELSTRGRGAFAVAIADEAGSEPAALVSIRAGTGAIAVPGPALEVTVSSAAAGYRCLAAAADGRSGRPLDWASPSLAAAAERILALCAARQLCTAMAPEGLAAPPAGFSGSLAPLPAPAHPRPSALAQLLRVSMGLLINLI
jgi:hypothetical protein